MSFIGKIGKTARKHSMLAKGDTVLVAVSGGPDSVCLLCVLLALAQEYELTLHLAHLDHRFRGEESAAEARFVADLAKRFGIPATIEDRDVPAFCAERGLSAQAGAREVRYRFLQETAGTVGANRIALGHTANDQAETLLMRLVRGAGAAGLSGIPPVRENIIRPLIDVTREDVLTYLDEIGQDFVTDPTNLKPVYTRNRIRQEVLPVLERLNPQAVAALASAAVLLRDEDAVMDAETDAIAARMLLRDTASVQFSRQEFLALPPAHQRRLLRKALDISEGSPSPDLSWVQTQEAMAFVVEAQTGRTMKLPVGLALSREYDVMTISARQQEAGYCDMLAVPGMTEAAAAGITVIAEVLDASEAVENENNLWQAKFDYDKISLPLYLRTRRDGDRFQPAGMQHGSKKLQDFFVDEKVPQRRRGYVPVLATEESVLWIVGMRTDGRFLAGPGTKKALVVTVRKR